jgi:hypothetical protein
MQGVLPIAPSSRHGWFTSLTAVNLTVSPVSPLGSGLFSDPALAAP